MERITLKVKQFAIISLLAVLITSCNAQSTQEKVIETEVKEQLLLNPIAFSERLAKEKDPQIIDVRTPQEYNNGTIKDAVNWNILDGTFEQNLKKLDPKQTVFVFCAKGGRSGQAAGLLEKGGFSSIVDLKGGYGAWELFESKQ
jgi:rhodanese-related sulfurtransferase